MPKPDREIVRGVLNQRDRGAHVRDAIDTAWAEVKESYLDAGWWRRKSTRAALMWEHAVENAIARLNGDPGLHIVPHYDTVSSIFDQLVLLRFKKADLQLKTKNYPTALANLFHTHTADLFGYEGLHRVEAAYVLSRFETDLDWVGIVARERRRHLWDFELVAGGATIERFPSLPGISRPASERILRPKSHEKDTRKKKINKGKHEGEGE